MSEKLRADWAAFREYLGKDVLVPSYQWRGQTLPERTATLVDLRIGIADTDEYTAETGQFVRDEAALDYEKAALCATIRYLDTGRTNYRANPYFLCDPVTRRRIA